MAAGATDNKKNKGNKMIRIKSNNQFVIKEYKEIQVGEFFINAEVGDGNIYIRSTTLGDAINISSGFIIKIFTPETLVYPLDAEISYKYKTQN